ncbi:MAG TPA: glycosyltransferase family 4 protein [bacterium]|nr:glycosyltransferase family 4 protein [bacterium]
MKIIYCANVRIPTEKAHGLQIMKTTEAFCTAGAATELVVPRRANPCQTGVDPFAFYRVAQKFPLITLYSPDPAWLMSGPAGLYIKAQSFFFIIWLFFYLLFKKNKANYIFYTREEYLLPVLLLFSRQVVWEAHSLPHRVCWYKKFWSSCLKIVVISQGLKDALISLGLKPGKIIVAPDGVDLDDFHPAMSPAAARAQFGLPQDKKIILYSGQLYVWKGAETLAQAAHLLLADCLIVFVGGVGEELQKLKRQFGAANNILILGQKPYTNIPYYLRSADVLVLPNSGVSERSRLWTSPLKLFEYLASGTPIVASDLPSVREVLNDQNSFFFTPDNPESLAKAINSVFGDPSRARAKTVQALMDSRAYSWSKRAELIINNLK